jgi:Zn-dependent M32 family carboxypeptidase
VLQNATKQAEICLETRKQWEEDMVKAIYSSEEKKMRTLKAAQFFKVLRTTLQALVKKVTLTPKQAAETKSGRKTVLADSFEHATVN